MHLREYLGILEICLFAFLSGTYLNIDFPKCQTTPVGINNIFMFFLFFFLATSHVALGHRKQVNLESCEQTENFIWVRN